MIQERLGEFIFGYEDEELEHIVMLLLSQRQQSLATCECGTGGLLSYRLTEVNGSTDWYAGGIVSRLQSINKYLETKPEQDTVAFDAEGAAQIAQTTRERFNSDFALAILLDPQQSWQDPDQIPQAYVALANRETEWVEEIGLTVNRAIAKSRVTKAALNLLRRNLIQN